MDLVNEIKKEISRLQRALGFLESNSSPTATVAESRAEVAPKRRKMSASALPCWKSDELRPCSYIETYP
jgi:hypothetical protein